MHIIEEDYRTCKDAKVRMMFNYYEQNLKPKIKNLVNKQTNGKGIYYEAWIDLTDYFIPDNYEKLRQLDFDKAAELCVNYMIEREQKYYS